MITPAEYVLQLKTQLSLSPTSVSLNARGGGGTLAKLALKEKSPLWELLGLCVQVEGE